MQISADNMIRFPVMASPVTQRVEQREAAAAEEAAQVLAFAPVAEDPALTQRSQEHGQLFVAHRIIGRVADQLDQIATL
ncbi:hypothetical protein Oter_1141 [Opitutus terrae PB90-1]|uniref:Uncharacterized protein n=2 Tax=Opitutus terrae TaxID=107709 RepID=B1ZNJ5_OPITP|nr:hypothetical protein Oter_1141 [Opitutus terrae PB90-1]